MKIKLFYLFGISAFLFSSCGENHLADWNKAQHERDSVITLARANDSTVTSLMNSFADIQNAINNIKEKQNILSNRKKDMELKGSYKEELNKDIQAINDLLEENRKSIADLNDKLKKTQYRNGQLNKMIATLNAQLLDKNMELAMLNESLLAKDNTITSLQNSLSTITIETEGRADTISQQRDKLNMAYFVVGNSKSLKEKNVINAEGGFLGLGREKVLKSDFSSSSFTAIDITKTKDIPVSKKKAKLITNHPSGSYKLKMDDKNQVAEIEITDPDQFWKVSKYLVIMTD